MSHNAAVREVAKATQKVVREIDNEIARIRRDADKRIERLRAERTKWENLVELPHRKRPKGNSTAIAGPGAIRTVEEYMTEHETAYQSDITTGTGLNSGTVTHALRHLAGQGKIVVTGNKRRNSAEFHYLAVEAGADERQPVAA